MPGRDGTGPLGQGAMTGRGFGVCSGVNRPAYGRGLGLGFGRGYNCRRANYNPIYSDTKEALAMQKAVLEARLDAINKQLDKE